MTRRRTLLAAVALAGLLVPLSVACTSPDDGTAPTSTTLPGPGSTPDTEGALLLAGQKAAQLLDPAGDTRDQEWLCIGLELQRDPALGEAAQQPLAKADVDTRKKLLRVVADCVGPDATVDIYLSTNSITTDRRSCIKQLMLARPLDEQLAVVAGDGDSADVFAKRVATQCPPTGGSGTTLAGAAPPR